VLSPVPNVNVIDVCRGASIIVTVDYSGALTGRLNVLETVSDGLQAMKISSNRLGRSIGARMFSSFIVNSVTKLYSDACTRPDDILGDDCLRTKEEEQCFGGVAWS
jgi:hypothetical protein